MGRILGIDLGNQRIGLAISDPLGYTAQGLSTLRWSGLKNLLKALKELVSEKEVEEIVVGLPLNLNGTLGRMALKSTLFIRSLKKQFSIPIIPWDERFTSAEAERICRGIKKKKGTLDKMAAILILQSYLDYKRRPGSE